MSYARTAQNKISVTCNCVPNCFYLILGARLAGKGVENHEKRLFVSVFSLLDSFSQDFRQVREWLILQLHEMIRVLHVVACPIVCTSFMVGIGIEECWKLSKMIIFKKYFHQFLFLSLSFWAGKWVAYIRMAWNDKNATCSYVPSCFYLVLWSTMAGRSVQTYEKWSFFSAFSRFGPFRQIFGQVKERLMLELHKIIRMSLAISCQLFFRCFIRKVGRKECSKLLKMIF